MHPLQFAFAVAAAIACAACSTPPAQITAKGDESIYIDAQPVEAVYRKVVQGSRGCYPGKDVASDYFQDNRTARVAMSVKTGLSISTLYVVDLAAAQQGTSVSIRHLKGTAAFPEAIKQWIGGNFKPCPYSGAS